MGDRPRGQRPALPLPGPDPAPRGHHPLRNRAGNQIHVAELACGVGAPAVDITREYEPADMVQAGAQSPIAESPGHGHRRMGAGTVERRYGVPTLLQRHQRGFRIPQGDLRAPAVRSTSGVQSTRIAQAKRDLGEG